MSLKGKVSLITGSTSGIGLGIAKKLASQGSNIMLNGFGDADEIEKIRKSIESEYTVECRYLNADLSKADEAVNLVNETISTLGSLEILVNNAGIQHVDKVEDFPIEKWDFIMSLMLSAPFYTIRTAIPQMKKQNWGRIINISSVHGKVASPFKSAYVSAKHGLIGLTKVVSLETAELPITCNAICPGWVLTPLVSKQVDIIAEDSKISWDEAKLKLLTEKQPSKEFVKPEDIGDFTLFLCSDAASQITGADLSMDGGWSVR